MSTIIYHAPFPLDREAKAASGIRPVRMVDAFRSVGHEVIEVTGSARQRRAAIKSVGSRIRKGLKVDFLYSESATIPTMLTEPRHLPPHPFLDPELFRICHVHRVPTGLFYRDIYWAFPEYTARLGHPLADVMKGVYHYDLRWYRRWVDVLYLPSMGMAPHVPVFPASRMRALPPGATICDVPGPRDGLHLLYVGGLGGHYQLEESVRAVADLPGVTLTICTRPQQWEDVRAEYEPLMAKNIRVVHESGEGLEALYRHADISLVYVQPDPYREFAAPVKLYEYIGHGRPVIASEGTLAGSFIRDNGCGWTIPYGHRELRDLLEHLSLDRSEVESMADRVHSVRREHTWEARAHQVADDMARLRDGETDTEQRSE